MEIKLEDIKHLADLSNFALDEVESQALKTDLQNIIKYISELDGLDTSEIEPVYQVAGLENIWRVDEILPQEADRAALLALTAASEDYQIKVPKVL